MFSKKHVAVVALLTATFFASGAQAINIVTNPGFETGTFAGWAQSGNLGFTFIVTSPVHSGSFAASFGPVGSNGILSQTLTTVPGSLYDIDFWLRNDGGTPNFFSAAFDGALLTSLTDSAGFGYTEFSFTNRLATTASTILQFQFRQDPAFFQFDDVSVQARVPEPGTLTLFGVGLIAAGAWRLRRKTKA